MAAKPARCACGSTHFRIVQLAEQRIAYETQTRLFTTAAPDDIDGDTYPQSATCARCGADCTALLNEGAFQFYGPPPEMEPDPAPEHERDRDEDDGQTYADPRDERDERRHR